MFDFSTGFVHKFVQGRLEFWVGEAPRVDGTYEMYKRARSRRAHSGAEPDSRAGAADAAQALATNVLPQNREYLYHHYNDNCSTRPRDIVDVRVRRSAHAQPTSAPSRMSLREHTRRYSQVFPPMSLVLDYLQNDELDRPITQREEAFLPDELERQLDALTVDGQPAVKQKIFCPQGAGIARRCRSSAPYWNVWLLRLGSALAGALVLALGRATEDGSRGSRSGCSSRSRAWCGARWACSSSSSGMWTNHEVAHRNENLFLINPLTFALLPLGLMLVKGSKRAPPGAEVGQRPRSRRSPRCSASR